MINIPHLLKVSAAWVSILYVVCYAAVAAFSGIRQGFMLYSLHTRFDMGASVLSFGNFVSGLVIWNIIALVAVWLFAALHNGIKK